MYYYSNFTQITVRAFRLDGSISFSCRQFGLKQLAKTMAAIVRIAAEHKSFNCIRQVAPTCTMI